MLGRKRMNDNAMQTVTTLIGAVVLIVIAVVLYPLIGDSVTDLTDNTSANYVGAQSAPIVGLIPIFYWLAVALVVIGIAVISIKQMD